MLMCKIVNNASNNSAVPTCKQFVKNLILNTNKILMKAVFNIKYTHIHTTVLRLYGFCPGQLG